MQRPMLSSVDRKRERPSATPRRVWRLSDPNALARLAGQPPRELPDLFAEPVEQESHETPALEKETPESRARLEAVPDVNQLVKLEVETRQRLKGEVQLALQEALEKLTPPPPRPSSSAGAALAWMLIGLSLGALAVFVLVGRPAPATIISAAAPPTTTAPVCIAPEIAPLLPVASASPSALSSIPTFSVLELPKPKPKPLWIPPRPPKVVVAPAPPDTPAADEDNPYLDGSE